MNIEKILEETKEECIRGINNATTYGGRLSWYYTHCGEIDMAFNLGLITIDLYDDIKSEWNTYRPAL